MAEGLVVELVAVDPSGGQTGVTEVEDWALIWVERRGS
jgi:hypothetical protein